MEAKEKKPNWALLGIPDHEGVRAVGGRIGAASGPKVFREAFAKLNGRLPLHRWMKDFGDVSDVSSDVEKNHRQAIDSVEQAHTLAGLSVIVGGGHDHGYSQLEGVLRSLRKNKKKIRLGCINLDAHLDVRKPEPTINSGSPFYLALENKTVAPQDLIEFGIQSHCNGAELQSYIHSKKARVVPFTELRNGKAASAFARVLKPLAARCDAVVLSFDLDAVAAAFAPGVSAPQVEGFSPSDILAIMEIAGRHPKVTSLGIFELNPEFDRDSITAKLAAISAFHFLEGKKWPLQTPRH